jgi:hypothetical protein
MFLVLFPFFSPWHLPDLGELMEENICNLVGTLNRMQPAYAALLGAFVGAAVTLVGTVITPFLNARLQKGTDQKRWLRDKKEEAYRESLNLLALSRRRPVDGALELNSYLGAMDSIVRLPVWLTLLMNYSSRSARAKVKPSADMLLEYIDRAKRQEAELPAGSQSIPNIAELFHCVEAVLAHVQELSRTELLRE